jgi:preprotein translocase subunit YajC
VCHNVLAAPPRGTDARGRTPSRRLEYVDPIFLFFLVMLVFLYLLLVRPQRQQAKRHQEMLQNLAVGDEVITAGGIYGEVTGIDDERVQLEIDADVRIAVSRRAIASKVTLEEAAQMAGEPEEAPEPMEAPEAESIDAVEPAAEEQVRR